MQNVLSLQDLASRARSSFLTDSKITGWFIIDGTTVGVASETIFCLPGQEAHFKKRLSAIWADQNQREDWVLALAYEFDAARNRRYCANGDEPVAVALRIHNKTVLTDHELAAIKPQGNKSPKFHMPKEEYLEAVREAQRHIKEGNAGVLCVTNRLTFELGESDALKTYLALQAASEAPCAGLIEWQGGWLVSASLERFISKRGTEIVTAPIKGTRPRGKTVAEDTAIKIELATNDKELTENGRVTRQVARELETICTSVRVSEEPSVLSFKQVHQLVGKVSAECSSKTDLWRLIAAMFPAASMTGTPKDEAISILCELERAPRGWYSGCFGTVSADGRDAELAMTIRSLESDGESITIGTGGGITEASDAEQEWQEMLLKAKAMIDAV